MEVFGLKRGVTNHQSICGNPLISAFAAWPLVLPPSPFAGQTITAEDIRVVADEAGALADRSQTQAQSAQTQLGGGGSASLFGGSRGSRLTNQVRTNLGRAKAIEAAGGRILSFIEVVDLPQVRVDIRLMEVNRTKLRALDPNAALALSTFRQPSLNPAQSAEVAQAKANELAAKSRLKLAQIDLAVSFAEKLFSYRETSRNLALIEDNLIPQANQTREIVRAAYRTSTMDFSSLTDAERILLELKLNAAEVRTAREIALADLSLMVAGVPPANAPLLKTKTSKVAR